MHSKRVTIDSNVYLSALLFGGNPRRVVEAALLGGQPIVISEEIFTEMLKVISRKFPKFLGEYHAFEVILRENTICVPLGSVSIYVCRDAKDNMILETAVIGGCSLIITGDKDLCALGTYKNITISTPAAILNI